MFSWKTFLQLLGALALVAYLGVSLTWAHRLYMSEPCRGIDIEVVDTAALAAAQGGEERQPFLTVEEVERLLHYWQLDRLGGPIQRIDTNEMERLLNGQTNIESAQAVRTPRNRLRLEVRPMEPVARVFEPNGSSYYINRQGKRLTANRHYRRDVPVISGHFDVRHPASEMLPLIERLAKDPAWSALVAQINVDSLTRDVILMPMIRGHVVNLGDLTALDSKLNRVMTMYRRVMPVKGWEYYDTLSVKWGGQVVATRRAHPLIETSIELDPEGDDDADISTMLAAEESAADTVATMPPSGLAPHLQ